MNDSKQRKRLIWIAVLAGVLVLSLLFVSLAAPSGPSEPSAPVIRAGDSPTFGTSPAPTASQSSATSGGAGFSIGGGQAVSLIWRLGLVAVIIAVSIVGLRWWGKKTAGPRSMTGFIKVVDTLAISNGRTIHLVALGDRVIAVGATAQQLTLLNELTEEEAATVLTENPRDAEQPLAAFAAELFQSMRRGGRQNRPGSRQTITGDDHTQATRQPR